MLKQCLFVWLSVGLFYSYAYVFTVSPMNVILDCGTNATGASFELKNGGDEPLVVDVKVGRRVVDLQGKEKVDFDQELKKSFTVFPPRVSLGPKDRKMVRLAARAVCGQPKELPYRVIFEQLPIKGTPSSSTRSEAKVNLMMKYLAALYVTPPGAKPSILISEIQSKGDRIQFKV